MNDFRETTRVGAAVAAILLACAAGCRLETRRDNGRADFIPVDSSPRGAEVVLDGRVIGVTPMTAIVRHEDPPRLTIRLDGYVPAEVTIPTLSRTLGDAMSGITIKDEAPIFVELQPVPGGSGMHR